MSIWINKKNGSLYEMLCDTVVDKTNANDGKVMAMYKDVEGKTYVRDRAEFYEKFARAETSGLYTRAEMRDSSAKMVIVVRRDLKLLSGKMSSQTAHAALGAILNRCEWLDTGTRLALRPSESELSWLKYKFTKIILGCEGLREMLDLQAQAISEGINTCLITDAGDTVFHNVPTVTCLAIGPDWAERINPITGHLNTIA